MIKVLIVDDDKEICQGLEKMLAGEGYKTTSVSSGEEAVKKLDEAEFDIILTDLLMPGMSGMELLKEAKRIKPNAHVIMITAFATIESAVEAMKKGASDYISKPLKLHEVRNTLKRILEESEFEKKLRQKLPQRYDLGIDAVIKSLSNPMRRGIVELLYKRGKSRFTDIKKELAVDDATKLSFHLRTLRNVGLIEQDSEKVYSLCSTGKKIIEALRNI